MQKRELTTKILKHGILNYFDGNGSGVVGVHRSGLPRENVNLESWKDEEGWLILQKDMALQMDPDEMITKVLLES